MYIDVATTAIMAGTLVVTEYVVGEGSSDVVVGGRCNTLASVLEARLKKRFVRTPFGKKFDGRRMWLMLCVEINSTDARTLVSKGLEQ